uniref:Uncharacterized protein n=1 Tax=Anguilla anguilla TaxID=7936 RepID=A0A0E9WQF6_ANGAN
MFLTCMLKIIHSFNLFMIQRTLFFFHLSTIFLCSTIPYIIKGNVIPAQQ